MLSGTLPSHRPVLSCCRPAVYVAALLAALLTLDGCSFFRSKPDLRVQQMTSRLEPGLTPDEVLALLGPPQRQGQNLFDRRKAYWIYEFTDEKQNKRRRGGDAQDNGLEPQPRSELQLLFDRGLLVNWSHVPRN